MDCYAPSALAMTITRAGLIARAHGTLPVTIPVIARKRSDRSNLLYAIRKPLRFSFSTSVVRFKFKSVAA